MSDLIGYMVPLFLLSGMIGWVGIRAHRDNLAAGIATVVVMIVLLNLAIFFHARL